MDNSDELDGEQKALWNGIAGRSWVDVQETLEQMLRPFEEILVQEVRSKPRACVLDVGCGTGSTTLALGRYLGADGRCVGVDISEPMIDCARRRAEREEAQVSFICADAGIHSFERGWFDTVVSRFGVMFFSDPVRAFVNLRRACQDGAELCLIAWRSPSENPFMTAAEHAAAKMLPDIPRREPDAPGQFGFANAERVRRILEESNWVNVNIDPVDAECTFPAEELPRYATNLGLVGRVLANADVATKERVWGHIRPAFDRYVRGESVRFDAACWRIRACAG